MSLPAQPLYDLPKVIITPSSPTANGSALLPSHPNHPKRTQRNRPKTHRSYTAPEYSTKHLYPPSPFSLPPAKSGRRPLRSPLYSLAMLLVGLVLIASSVMCAGDSAEALLEMEQKGLRKLGDVGRGVGAKLGWDVGQEKEEQVEIPIVSAAESAVTDDEEAGRVSLEKGRGVEENIRPSDDGSDTERLLEEQTGSMEMAVEELELSGEPSEL
ncbi:hypothetical protein L202_07793 [Cryptococcus amylolentus CBS 6039]|uniref:Uncharacterized protein n=2 Tax=Cryptococcus amylolentus TaxID=104669 RepID=A0A1E3HA61_9TREE|nr:hypothetical protein L202_07793 [Cryptococcus amylolentus CBS 6039]ODN73237.1 hypothetical protein L202_07793 [Cryptococcus amylolentus CBS 6039]ODN99052.1 hypothetical protein I350_07206 [Cryptococcus amylolentus CBS 6273]